MHTYSAADSVLFIYYKWRKYALSEVGHFELNIKIQSVDCKNQAPDAGFTIVRQSMKIKILRFAQSYKAVLLPLPNALLFEVC